MVANVTGANGEGTPFYACYVGYPRRTRRETTTLFMGSRQHVTSLPWGP